MSKTAEQVWQEFMKSTQEKNDNWYELLAEDIEFIGPVMRAQGKKNYIKMNLDFFQMVRGFELIRYATNENLVTTEAKITVATPKGGEITMEVAEFYEVKNEKIQSVKIFYDAEEFRQEFGMK